MVHCVCVAGPVMWGWVYCVFRHYLNGFFCSGSLASVGVVEVSFRMILYGD